jgi:hypothetical protein
LMPVFDEALDVGGGFHGGHEKNDGGEGG